MKKIIYDFGANDGSDIPYYLKKADFVVAVEANPQLCSLMQIKYHAEISSGKLFIENCVLTTDDEILEVPFYIHKNKHILSQFPRPNNDVIEEFEQFLLPSRSASSLIRGYGEPYYIKIDIEHFDAAILRSLFENSIFPPYISAESHDIEIFALLVSFGGYKAFKLVNGPTVSIDYGNHTIKTSTGLESYSFPVDSAGPFGEDVHGEWMTSNNFFKLLAYENLGHKDIHATKCFEPNVLASPALDSYAYSLVARKSIEIVKPFIPRFLRRMVRVFIKYGQS